MNKERIDGRLIALAVGLAAVAVLSRLVPHMPNLVPVGAIALLCGSVIRPTWLGLSLPLLAVFASDLAMELNGGTGFYSGMGWVYASYLLVSLLGYFGVRSVRMLPVAAASLAGPVVFFAVSNFGVWASGSLYPTTVEGLISCYTAALPFFRNSVVADVTGALVLFAVWSLATYSLRRRAMA